MHNSTIVSSQLEDNKYRLIDKASILPKNHLPIRIAALKSFQTTDDLFTAQHVHNYDELIIISSGSAIHHINGESRPVQTGDTFLIKRGQNHYFSELNNLSLHLICFDRFGLPIPEILFLNLPNLKTFYENNPDTISHIYLPPPIYKTAHQIINQMIDDVTRGKEGYDLSLFLSFQRLLFTLGQATQVEGQLKTGALIELDNVINYINENFTDNISISHLCNLAQMARSTFMRKFRDAVGLTPIDYLNYKRIDHAKQLLQTSCLSITDIANESGFKDSNYFARIFRKSVGQSPREFRNQINHRKISNAAKPASEADSLQSKQDPAATAASQTKSRVESQRKARQLAHSL